MNDAVDHDTVRVGTRGWRHRDWRGPFYPRELPESRWLAHYARHFDCVEVESSRHRLPEPAQIARWCEATPEGFAFVLRAPRLLTHRKKLKGCEQILQEMHSRLALFGPRLGALVFELPPRWHPNVIRFTAFLAALPDFGAPVLFELGDPRWHCAEVHALLAEHGAGLCVDEDTPLPAAAGAIPGYVGLGAADEVALRSDTLRGWAGRARGWARAGGVVFVFLGNHSRARAVRNARRLRELLEERP